MSTLITEYVDLKRVTYGQNAKSERETGNRSSAESQH